MYILPHFCAGSLISVYSASLLYIQPHFSKFSLTSVQWASLLYSQPQFHGTGTETHTHTNTRSLRLLDLIGPVVRFSENIRCIIISEIFYIWLSNMDHLWDLKRGVRSNTTIPSQVLSKLLFCCCFCFRGLIYWPEHVKTAIKRRTKTINKKRILLKIVVKI